jgi:peptidoglycan/xylan/chitin deacetylase (PgdA/CDA1 family)
LEENHMPWGPEAKRGAICLTFDNFGEAAELEYGLWPKDEPIGKHYTATIVLPQVLQALDSGGISATFFVEGWNASIYAHELSEIRAVGHELALHGWRHEVWSEQTAHRREEILALGGQALSSDTGHPVGFRPPGGMVTDDTPSQLAAAGFHYVSPVGEGALIAGPVASLPFRWTEVDAFYFEPFMAPAREDVFGTGDERPAGEWQQALEAIQARALEAGGCYTVIFHIYLIGQQTERLEALQAFIQQLSVTEDLWVTSCAEISQWLHQHPESSGTIHHERN